MFSSFHTGGREYDELKEAKSTGEAREQFDRYPVEKQIDIYLFGLKYVEPDDSSAKKFLVNDGERRIPTIIQRVQDTDEEFDKAYLMEVISLIDKDCNCVSEDQKAILFQVGLSLKDRWHRSRFLQAFEELNK
jgi:hypothetical protein